MNAAAANNNAVVVLMFMGVTLALLMFLFAGVFFMALARPWLRGFLSGVPVSMVQLIAMRIRGTPPLLIVDALVTLTHRGHPFGRALTAQVESTYLAQRGAIRSPEHLADLVEKQLRDQGAATAGAAAEEAA